jgi:hypothetical protein
MPTFKFGGFINNPEYANPYEGRIPFVYRSKVHLVLVGGWRAKCSQRIRYSGPSADAKNWQAGDQCKRCFKGL